MDSFRSSNGVPLRRWLTGSTTLTYRTTTLRLDSKCCRHLVLHLQEQHTTGLFQRPKSITLVWDTDLPHYDSTRDPYQDERHLVTFSFAPFSPHEYGLFTAWRTDTRPWVATEDMIAYEVPGMVFFAMTGEYVVGDGEN